MSDAASPPLPRRDLWLLPLISVLTVLVMLGASEVLARLIWPARMNNSCAVMRSDGTHYFRPNCTSRMQTAEGPWYVNHYNECGYRSAQSCGPLAPGALRIALLGSSVAEGLHVPYEKTIGARLGVDLTAICHRPVEVQNLGSGGAYGWADFGQMDSALALKPNAIMLVVTVFDIQALTSDRTLQTPTGRPDPGGGLMKRLLGLASDSRAAEVAEHFLFEQRSIYLPLYLRYGDKADYLRPPFTHAWRGRLKRFDALVDRLSQSAHAAGAPLIIAYAPPMAPVILMTSPNRTPGVDPAAMTEAVRAIALRHGALFMDGSDSLRRLAKPETMFYVVDSHLSGDGQTLVGSQFAQTIASIPVSGFEGCATKSDPHGALAQ